MSAETRPRELGVILHCNGRPLPGHKDEHGFMVMADGECGATVSTGVIVVRHNRTFAATLGWSRGLRTGAKRLDLCPACTKLEVELAAKDKAAKDARNAERSAAREAKRAAARASAVPQTSEASP